MAQISQRLHVGAAMFNALVARVQQCETMEQKDYYDEQVWTFLLAASYAMAGDNSIATRGSLLTEDAISTSIEKLWFECMPMPPRTQESNTQLDLALGAIARRDNTLVDRT